MSAAQPVLSIIMPVYNEAEYLAFALESVLIQETDFAYEIIVVDDCSTDGTAGIVETYRQAYPHIMRYFRNPENKGTAYSFWHGLTESRGDFFHVLDGDDFFIRRDKLQRQVDFLRANPDFVAVATNSLRLLKDGSFYPEVKPMEGEREYTYQDVIHFRFYFHTSSYMFRNVYRGNVPDYLCKEWARKDGIRTLIHGRHGKVKYLDFIGSVYRFVEQGIWSSLTQQQKEKRIIWALEQYAENLATTPEEKQAFATSIAYRQRISGKKNRILRTAKLWEVLALLKRPPHETVIKLFCSDTRHKAVAFIRHAVQVELNAWRGIAQGEQAASKLRKIYRYLSTVSYSSETRSKVFTECYMADNPDQFCEAIGKIILDKKRDLWLGRKFDSNLIVILVGGIQKKSGGVMREILDLIRIHRAQKQKIVVLSNERVETTEAVINSIDVFNDPEVEFLRYTNSDKDFYACTVWLMDKLLELKPIRIYPFASHNDIMIPTAVQAGLAKEIVLDFCFDHGVSLMATHSAINNVLVKLPYHYHMLKKGILERNLTYIPFFMEDATAGKYPPYAPLASGALTTMTACARNYKVAGYVYAYSEIVARMLARTGGRHVHLGPLDEAQQQEIQTQLHLHEVPEDRFVHILWSDDLTQTARDYQVDAYLQSFPVGSGRTSVEMMRAGILIINHIHNTILMFNSGDFCAPECPIWNTPEELMEILDGLDASRLAYLSRHVRIFFEENNDFQKTKIMVSTLRGKEPTYQPRYEKIVLHRLADDFPEESGFKPKEAAKESAKLVLRKAGLFNFARKVMVR